MLADKLDLVPTPLASIDRATVRRNLDNFTAFWLERTDSWRQRLPYGSVRTGRQTWLHRRLRIY